MKFLMSLIIGITTTGLIMVFAPILTNNLLKYILRSFMLNEICRLLKHLDNVNHTIDELEQLINTAENRLIEKPEQKPCFQNLLQESYSLLNTAQENKNNIEIRLDYLFKHIDWGISL